MNHAAVYGKLIALGPSPFTVAQTLERLGARGSRRSATRCPVARYLSAELGAEILVGVNRCFELGSEDPGVPLPPAVGGFVQRFDAGEIGAKLLGSPADARAEVAR